MPGQGNVLQVRIGRTLPGKSRACTAVLHYNVEFALLFCIKDKLFQQKTNTGVSPSDSEGPCKVWTKTESCFSNENPQNWSISFQFPKRAHISDFIDSFCLKSKLPEPQNLPRSFLLWQWRAMPSLGQNWILLSK